MSLIVHRGNSGWT